MVSMCASNFTHSTTLGSSRLRHMLLCSWKEDSKATPSCQQLHMPPLLPLLNRYNVKFCELVGALELYGLRVRCFIADGASTNQRSTKLHSSDYPDYPITHRAVNFCNPDRDIYFVSVVQHLFKTTINNYQISGANLITRSLIVI